MEAARLYVTVGAQGVDKLSSDLKHAEAVVDGFGSKHATAVLSVETSSARARIDELAAKYEAAGFGSRRTLLLLADNNPAIRAIGEVSRALGNLRSNIVFSAQGGGLGTFAQDLSTGVGLRGSIAGVGSRVAGGMATGGFGGGISAGLAALGPIGVGALGAAGIGGFALMKAGEQERFETQLSVLLGGLDQAKARIAELTTFAATTPFELPEVVNASKTLQVFTGDALSSGDALRLIGDVAAGTGSNFGETAMWFGRMYDAMKSGRPFGEATMRLQEMGAMGGKSREVIERLGASVKDGSMTMEQAWKLAQAEFGRFSGMMDKQSMTLEGKLSNLSDAVGQAASKLGALLLPAAKMVVDGLIAVTTAVGDLIGMLGGADKAIEDFWDSIPDAAPGSDPIGEMLGEGPQSWPWPFGTKGQPDWAGGDPLQDTWDAIEKNQGTARGMATAMRAGGAEFVKAAEGLAGALPQALLAMKDSAVVISKQTVIDISNALRDNRTEWQKAVDGLKYDMDNSMTATAELAAVKAELAAISASEGWKSGDPVWIASLNATQQILTDRLAELAPMAGKAGKGMMDEMSRLIKSSDRPKNAADAQIEALAKKFEGMPGFEWGAALIRQWASGMRSAEGAVTRQVLYLGGKVANLLRLASPAKEGPLSEGGGPEGWGERGGLLYAVGWGRARERLAAALSRIEAPSASFGAPVGRLAAAGGAPTGGLHIAAIHVDARGSTDPDLVGRRARQGVMDGVAESFRQQNARLPAGARS